MIVSYLRIQPRLTSVNPLYGQSMSHKINNICIGTAALEVKYLEMPVMKLKTMKLCHFGISYPVLPCYCVLIIFIWDIILIILYNESLMWLPTSFFTPKSNHLVRVIYVT